MNKRRRYKAKARRKLARELDELIAWWQSGVWLQPRELGVDLASGPDYTVETYHAQLGPVVHTVRRDL